MSYEYSEDGLVENATQQVLEELDWKVVYAWKNETLGEDGLLGRETKSEVVLRRYLLAALKRYNKDLPELAYTPVKVSYSCVSNSLLSATKRKVYELPNFR